MGVDTEPWAPTATELVALCELIGAPYLAPVAMAFAEGRRGNVGPIIAKFDRWAGGKFTNCVAKLRGKKGISNPERLCAWMKDRKTGTTFWRGKGYGGKVHAPARRAAEWGEEEGAVGIQAAEKVKSDYAYTPSDNSSEWKLDISDPAHVSAAAAALGPGGFRGQRVQIPESALPGVRARVRAAWRRAYPDKDPEEMPESLKAAEPTASDVHSPTAARKPHTFKPTEGEAETCAVCGKGKTGGMHKREMADTSGVGEVKTAAEPSLSDGDLGEFPEEPDYGEATLGDLEEADAAMPTGYMVALYLDAAAADELAVEGGESPEDLHVTLAYCGEGDEIDPFDKARALIALSVIAATTRPLAGEVGGVGRFNGESEDPEAQDAFIGTVDVPGLAELRQRVCAALRESGIEESDEHGFMPHVTLSYIPQTEDMPFDRLPEAVPVTFTHLTIADAGENVDFALGGDGGAKTLAPELPVEAYAEELLAEYDLAPPVEAALRQFGRMVKWEEAKHPRGEGGQFAKGEGGDSSSDSTTAGDGAAKPKGEADAGGTSDLDKLAASLVAKITEQLGGGAQGGGYSLAPGTPGGPPLTPPKEGEAKGETKPGAPAQDMIQAEDGSWIFPDTERQTQYAHARGNARNQGADGEEASTAAALDEMGLLPSKGDEGKTFKSDLAKAGIAGSAIDGIDDDTANTVGRQIEHMRAQGHNVEVVDIDDHEEGKVANVVVDGQAQSVPVRKGDQRMREALARGQAAQPEAGSAPPPPSATVIARNRAARKAASEVVNMPRFGVVNGIYRRIEDSELPRLSRREFRNPTGINQYTKGRGGGASAGGGGNVADHLKAGGDQNAHLGKRRDALTSAFEGVTGVHPSKFLGAGGMDHRKAVIASHGKEVHDAGFSLATMGEKVGSFTGKGAKRDLLDEIEKSNEVGKRMAADRGDKNWKGGGQYLDYKSGLDDIHKTLSAAHAGGRKKASEHPPRQDVVDGFRLFSELPPQAFVDAPEWFTYLPRPGAYKHPRYGTVKIDRDRAANFVKNFKAGTYQSRLPIDAEHQTKVSGALGWITDMRQASDGSVEARAEWTGRGRGMLADDRFGYFSPEWFDEWPDPLTGERHRDIAIGGALTGRPFYKEGSLPPLFARAAGELYTLGEGEEPEYLTAGEAGKEETPMSVDARRFAELEARLDELEGQLADARAGEEAASLEAKTMAEQVVRLTTDERTRRFTDEVLGRSEAGGKPWMGDIAAHVTHMESLARQFGEDSDEFRHYISLNRAHAAQVAAGRLFTPQGVVGAGAMGAGAWERIEQKAKAMVEADTSGGLTFEQAIDRVAVREPQLYTEYLDELEAAKPPRRR